MFFALVKPECEYLKINVDHHILSSLSFRSNFWHMDTSGIKPKKIDFLNECIAFVFGFSNNKGEMLTHWIAFAEGFTYPPQEFYATLEKELTTRKIPSMEISKVEFTQGGWLSGKRTYLRMMRERLALDTCAAPFGTGYFFSCRTLYIPPLIRLWHLLVLFLFFNLIGGILIKPLGFTFAIVAEIGLAVAIAAVLRNTVSMGLSDLDTFLLKMPVIGPIYERVFREETYYRFDTRLLYLKTIPELIQKLAEEITGEKGIKLVQQYECASIFGELYKPLPPRKAEPEK